MKLMRRVVVFGAADVATRAPSWAGLLDEHVRCCVRNAATGPDGAHADEMVTEATRAIDRLLKS
jgi:hypothetical protein